MTNFVSHLKIVWLIDQFNTSFSIRTRLQQKIILACYNQFIKMYMCMSLKKIVIFLSSVYTKCIKMKKIVVFYSPFTVHNHKMKYYIVTCRREFITLVDFSISCSEVII